MSRLCLYLLGPPRIERDGEPIQVDTRKATALLAYIASTAQSHRRDSLVNLLWPEYDRARGRTALRRTLYGLRKALTGDWLDVDREHIGLDPDADVWLDVDDFHAHLDECLTHGHPAGEVCHTCLIPLTEAAELYRGDFLSGFSLSDSFNFDDWQFFQADGLRRELAEALDRLVRCLAGEGAFEAAMRYARRWLGFDRLNEEAHCQLMRLYAWTGQRSAALRQYEECVSILASQLGVAPQPATVKLYGSIRENRVPVPPVCQHPPRPDKRPGRSPSALSEAGAGAADDGRVVTAARPAESDASLTGLGAEKRAVTVLCADIRGSLDGIGEGSAEAEASLARRLLGMVAQALARYGGSVDRALGGQVLGVFGGEGTRESDPELAIRAAIEIQREAEGIGLNVAVGINTGEVVIGGISAEGGRAFTLMSRVVDLAAGLAASADPGQILVSGSTRHLTRAAFHFTPLVVDIRGASKPVGAHRVDGLLAEPRKARGIEGLRAELVGREKELAGLTRVFGEALQGRGQIVSIIGEAGVGKSRLVAELREAAITGGDGRTGPLWLEGRCLGLGTAVSYAPFRDMFQAYFAWGAREADRRRYERIMSSLGQMVARGDLPAERVEEMSALLANLLSIHIGREEQFRSEDPEHVRWRTFAAVAEFFATLSRHQPVVLVFEDLHWADSLSLDLISLLMEELSGSPLLLVCVYRPEREHRCWHLGTIAGQKCREQYTELHVRELGQRQSRRLAKSLLGTADLSPAVEDLILARSQGNPFFIEEVVRSLIDTGVLSPDGKDLGTQSELQTVAIPDSVQSVILGRVDHLHEGWRHALEVASVIGRVFPRRVLARAIRPEIDLEQALWELEGRELVYQERSVPEVEYSFKHVLAQETVYGSLLRNHREGLHLRVAQAIEALYADNLDEHCEGLAHHYEQSGEIERAIGHLLRAGEKARQSYANEEAISHLSRGLSLLRGLPATPERDRWELDLVLAIGVPLVHSRGHAAREVEAVYTRARDLSEQVGGTPHLVQALGGLRRFRFARGELPMAYRLGEQALALSQTAQDALDESFVHMLHAETLYWLGAFAQARAHCEQGLACFDPRQRRSHAIQYGNDPGVGLGIYKVLSMWHLGFPDQALQGMQETLVLANELSHPFSLAFAYCFAADLHQLCGKSQAAQDLIEALVRVSAEHGYALYSTAGTILQSLLLAERRSEGEWTGRAHKEIAVWQAAGKGMWLTTWLARLALACGRVGRAEDGLRVLSQGLSRVEATSERCWEAEMFRIKGELLRMQGVEDAQAEASLQRALEVARDQGARSWELRAATSLARLWQDQGKTEEARRQLQGVYGWFTEGFDTADLKGAKMLLDALA